MRRSIIWIVGLAGSLTLGASSLAAQSTCYGNGCTLQVGVGAAVVSAVVPAMARVSVDQGAEGRSTVTLFANARLVIQTPDLPGSEGAPIVARQVPGGVSRSVSIPPGVTGSEAVYTIVSP